MRYVSAYWGALGSYRSEDAARLIAVLVPRVEAGQARIGALTDAYIARVAAQEFGGAINRGAIPDLSTEALRGSPATDVYERPFAAVWSGLAAGKSVSDAVSAGAARLTAIAETNLQLAKTHSARNVLQRLRVPYYERVVTGNKSCALCILASTQRYHSASLLPIHPGCDCTIRPGRASGTDQVLDPDLVDQLHASIKERFGSFDAGGRDVGLGTGRDYSDLVVVHQHGEIGPMLTVRGQHWDGPSAVN